MLAMRGQSDGQWGGFKAKEGRSPQLSFLDNLQSMKSMMIEQNRTSLKRLSATNQNFNEAYGYLNSILRRTTSQNQWLQGRVQELQKVIAKIDPYHPILSKNTNSGHISTKEQSHPFKTVPLPNQNLQNFAQRLIRPADPKQSKQKMKPESQHIKTFVWQHLQGSIIHDRQRNSSIPKEIVVRLYQRWSQINGHHSPLQPSLIKALLTAEMKRMLPGLQHSERDYLGVTFRKDLTQGVPIKQEREEREESNMKDENNEGLYYFDDAEEGLQFDF